jgi:hypothetical protein
MTSRTRRSPTLVALAALGLFGLSAASGVAGELAAEAQVGYFSMAASKSADAIFDSSSGLTWGAAARYSFDKGIYVNVGVRTFSKDGERVFVAGPADPVARLGFPLSIRVTPWFATAGYRFRQGELIVPYGGLGASLTSYREESTVAGLVFDDSRTKFGFHLVAGAEVGKGRFRFGAELGWSTVSDALGVGGVSEVYGEDNLGGWSVVGKFVFAFGGKKTDAETKDEKDQKKDEEK